MQETLYVNQLTTVHKANTQSCYCPSPLEQIYVTLLIFQICKTNFFGINKSKLDDTMTEKCMNQTKIAMSFNSFPASINFERNFTAFKIIEMLPRLTLENGDKNI